LNGKNLSLFFEKRAAYQIYRLESKIHGNPLDTLFLERVFQKLLLNFTWWVNRKDPTGANVFEGGFLGLDNIGVFNRSEALPIGKVNLFDSPYNDSFTFSFLFSFLFLSKPYIYNTVSFSILNVGIRWKITSSRWNCLDGNVLFKYACYFFRIGKNKPCL